MCVMFLGLKGYDKKKKDIAFSNAKQLKVEGRSEVLVLGNTDN